MDSFVSAKFSVESRPELEFEIIPMTEENHLEAAKICADTFVSTDPLSLAFDLTFDELYRFFSVSLAKMNVEKELGIVCYCKTNREIAAVLLHEGLNLDNSEITDERIRTAKRCMTYGYSQSSSKHQEWIRKTKECYVLDIIAVLPRYQKLGLGPIMLDFMLFKHPILKNAKYILAEILNSNMLRLALRKGFEIYWENKWEDFKNVQGCEDYENMNKILETKGNIRTEKIALVVFDREKYESQQIKDL